LLVAAGAVTVDGEVARRPAQPVGDDQAIAVSADPLPWVSRGALKLLHALDAFGLSPEGAVALDLGASTGGFTEVLLARGAREVWAVDVGRDQLAPALRADPRVRVREGVNVRDLVLGPIPPPAFVTADLSFISLVKALPPALDLAAPDAVLVALVKPQFEAGKAAVDKGRGVIRDPAVQEAALAGVRDFALAELGAAELVGIMDSPITGADGNREFLLCLRKATPARNGLLPSHEDSKRSQERQ
jgi:23S rRNA (cytidine1920-2'-O)/16S rRNA (cytidine1409-2'-O)-methyltransferase